jgi:hypothetical protein
MTMIPVDLIESNTSSSPAKIRIKQFLPGYPMPDPR